MEGGGEDREFSLVHNTMQHFLRCVERNINYLIALCCTVSNTM